MICINIKRQFVSCTRKIKTTNAILLNRSSKCVLQCFSFGNFFHLNFDSWHFNSCSHKFKLKGCEWKRIMQKKRVLSTLQIYRVCSYSVSNTKSQRNVNVAFINHKDFVFTTHFPCRCRNTFQSMLLTWNKWMRNHYMQRINKLNEIPSLCSGFLRTIRALNLSKGVAKIMKNLTK